MPKLFNLKKNNKLNLGIFEGLTINTPSILVVQDWLTIIDWANSNGRLEYLKLKTKGNFEIINKFCSQNDLIDFLAPNKLFRTNNSVCLKFIDPWFNSLNEKTQNQYLDKFWRSNRLVMINHQTGKKTQLVFADWKFQTGMTERDFEKSALKRTR